MKQSKGLLKLFLTLLLSLSPIAAKADGCILSNLQKNTDTEHSSMPIKEYICIDEKGDPLIKIQIQSLNEYLGNMLFTKSDRKWVQKIWGNHSVLKNEVWHEHQKIINKFGQLTNQTESSDEEYLKFSSQDDFHYTHEPRNEIIFYTLPRWPDFPLVNESLHILLKPDWPKTFMMNYPDHQLENNNEFSIRLWRNVTSLDIEEYDHDVKRFKNLFKKKQCFKRCQLLFGYIP